MNILTNGTIKCVNCHFSAKTVLNGQTYQYSINGGRPLTATDGEVEHVTDPYITSVTNMFSGQTKIKKVDLSGFDVEDLTNMDNMFQGCSNLESVNMVGLDLSNVTSSTDMFEGCSSSAVVNCNMNNRKPLLGNGVKINIVDPTWCWKGITKNGSSYYTRPYASTSQTSSQTSGREYCLNSRQTSNTMCYNMFYECYSLSSLDLRNLDTSKATTMFDMFYRCSSLTSLDVSTFDTSNVTDMYSMFQYCSSIKSLDLNNWDTSKVTRIRGMFSVCSQMTTLNIWKWNVSKVVEMGYLFNSCANLTSLNLKNWKTSSLTDASFMFQDCTSLRSLDLSNFDMSKVTSMTSMFNGCPSNLTITCKTSFKNWCTKNAITIKLPNSIQWNLVD